MEKKKENGEEIVERKGKKVKRKPRKEEKEDIERKLEQCNLHRKYG